MHYDPRPAVALDLALAVSRSLIGERAGDPAIPDVLRQEGLSLPPLLRWSVGPPDADAATYTPS